MSDAFITNPCDLFSLMENGALTVTPNTRLSQQLIESYFTSQPTLVVDKPVCIAYAAFLHRLYHQAIQSMADNPPPLLLTALHEQHLWQQVLDETGLGDIEAGLIEEIKEAWSRCMHWGLDFVHPTFTLTTQTRQFKHWHHAFLDKLKALNALTVSQLVPYLQSVGQLPANRSIVWVCFNDFTPQQLALQEALKHQNCKQYFYDLPEKNVNPYLFAAKDDEDEWTQIIEWLKKRIAQGETRIAVVVPNLENQSKRINRKMARHFNDALYNISLGTPLTKLPLIGHALSFLKLSTPFIPAHTVKLLLHSPFLKGSHAEFHARTRLLEHCKLLQEPVIPFAELTCVLQHKAPILAEILENMASYPEKASIPEWVLFFKKRLSHLGFPGEYPLQSETYQCLQRFVALIDELMPLTILYPTLDGAQAFAALKALAANTIFQPQKEASPIQILGLLEATGGTYDSIWVSGLTDMCLPQKTKLSPFIPKRLQREHHMPHTLPEQELKLAKDLLQRLQNGSGHTVFSYPRLIEDTPYLPSPLLHDLSPYASLSVPIQFVEKLEQRDQAYVLPRQLHESIKGGSALLANQAKCPFRAFAAHRLHAERSLETALGFNPMERGQLMHQLLERLWQVLKSHCVLSNYDAKALDLLIDEIIAQTLKSFLQGHTHAYPPLVQDVERLRLKKLMKACLDWEKSRPPFTVHALEKSYQITLAGLELTIRVDRIDAIGADQWIIDYKTTLPAHKPWHEQRPEEPQLLLYALLDDKINALLFAGLQSGGLTISGFSADKLPIKGVSTLKKGEQWNEKQQHWHRELTLLAEEFQNGYCEPIPKRKAICQQCDFQNLCRISL